jgi:Holliday junction DNA helicase RuvA
MPAAIGRGIIRAMIARLHGRVAAIEADAVVLDVGGVGYRVFAPLGELAELGPEGSPATLHTHLHVRDNEMSLYGAGDAATIELFAMLLSVSGIGPRLAMAMLSTYDAAQLQAAIVAEDVPSLTNVSGVGRKTAQRMILDLKGPLERLGVMPQAAPTPVADDTDTVDALTQLGYSVGEARRAVAASDVDAEDELEERVLAALRVLAGA